MKRKRLFHWILGLSVVCVSGFVILNVVAYHHAYRMTHFQSQGASTGRPEALAIGEKLSTLFYGVRIARPVTTLTPSQRGIPYEERTISGASGVKLGAWYIAGEKDLLVILFHGYTSEKSSLLEEAGALWKLGYSCLLVDFRGMGESSDSVVTIGFLEAEDVSAAVRFARDKLPQSKLVLYGQSMGAAAILRALYQGSVHPDGVILESVFDTMLDAVKNRFRLMGIPSFPSAQLLVFWGGRQFGFDGFNHNPANYAHRVTCPTLMMHGSNDPRALAEQALRVYEAIDVPKQFELFDGAAHQALVQYSPAKWAHCVAVFLDSIETR